MTTDTVTTGTPTTGTPTTGTPTIGTPTIGIAGPGEDPGGRGPTLARLVAAEWTKFWSVRSLPVVLVATAALVALPGIAFAVVVRVQFDTLSAVQRAGIDAVNTPFAGFQIALLAAAALGAVSHGGDLGSGALRTFVVAAPRRGLVIAAKAAVLVVAVFPVMLVVLAATWLVAQSVFRGVGLDVGIGFGGLLPGILGGAVALTGAALLGLALAAVTRRTTPAIVAVTVVLLLLPGLVGLVPGRTATAAVQRLPSTVAARLVRIQPSGPDQTTLDALTRRWAVQHPAESQDGGIVVAVRTADGDTYRSAAGHDSAGRDLTADTWLYMGSVTKTYVATALLRLQADGLVDLDAPVRRYVPDAPGDAALTVRDLLALRSGLPDYISTPGWQSAMREDPDRSWTTSEVLSELVPDGASAPGTYAYSNTSYVLAGRVLEQVTGESWQEAVERLVLQPLQLTGTDTTGQGHDVGPGLLADTDGSLSPVDPSRYTAVETSAGPAGAMVTTADGLAAMGSALLSGAALPSSQWAQMQTYGRDGGYGLGLADLGIVTRQPDGSSAVHAIGNNGEIPGYGGVLLMYPQAGDVVAVLANSDRVAAFEVASALAGDLGLDGDPQQVDWPAAATIWLGYLLVAMLVAAWRFRRGDL